MSSAVAIPGGWYNYGSAEVARVPANDQPLANSYPSLVAAGETEKSPYFVVYDVEDASARSGTQIRESAMVETITPGKVITALLTVIAGMASLGTIFIGVIYSNLRGDLDDLKKSNVEMVKSVSSIDKQVAVSNQRLDDILRELQRRGR